ncbi:hypothetical protein C1637_11450 [Chryseobacterium lactis]|uniref:Uncharacterized protein n=1 Tax=Chryseobacterium lactis TaxID=1241981 RepID=A0A3G6RNG8_CHRLC|nr:hypothetical protein EG342_02490 [Chryseobacterium lactis]AZB05848.1 hypothetical protein EG341_18615 [Chryseobacterium lactis]PNW13432.1 hypothetical protein C1637_11450 [Chryseobacterium lactis]
MKAILIMDKTSKDSFKVKKVIVNKIDSVYINTDKTIIYIINDKNEYISVRPDFKVEKLSHKPNVIFNSINSL